MLFNTLIDVRQLYQILLIIKELNEDSTLF
jgi:hypothetical protein